MNKTLIALACIGLLLTGCASTSDLRDTLWNGGVWNSVLGYNGPANSMDDAGGP